MSSRLSLLNWRLFTFVLASASILGACAGDGLTPETSAASDPSPEEIVVGLLDAIIEGRFEDTPALTDSVQAALLTLAEGADASEVLEAIDAGGEAVAANFWSGFAQTLEVGFDPAGLEIVSAEPIAEDGQEFVTVTFAAESGEPQTFVVRRNGVWQIDLMATFGAVLAERLVPPVESLLESANADAATVLSHFAEVAPSLRYATTSPDLPPEAHQSLLALIERVTRAG